MGSIDDASDFMGTLELLMLRGRSGNVYPFRVYPLPSALKPIEAVFVISKRIMESDGRGDHEPLYIGQTEDLADSLANYKKLPCVNKYRANCVCVHAAAGETEREKIENDLLGYYSLPCNH